MFVRAWLLIGLGLAPLPTRTESVQAPSSDARADWIESDLARVDQVLRALDAEDLDVATLTATLRGADVREDRPIGFGARRLVLAVYGGYTTTWVHVLAAVAEREGGPSRIAACRFDQLASVELPKEARERLAERWGKRAVALERGFRAERRDADAGKRLRANVEKALGACVVPDAPERLRAAFERLTSPFEDHVLGRACGDGGDAPIARAEVDALLAADRVDLLRAALRGMNPEGRAWAAWALRKRSKTSGVALDASDRAAIETLRATKTEYEACSGCERERLGLDEALRRVDE